MAAVSFFCAAHACACAWAFFLGEALWRMRTTPGCRFKYIRDDLARVVELVEVFGEHGFAAVVVDEGVALSDAVVGRDGLGEELRDAGVVGEQQAADLVLGLHVRRLAPNTPTTVPAHIRVSFLSWENSVSCPEFDLNTIESSNALEHRST